MPLSPTPPTGGWTFSCRPVGAYVWVCVNLLFVPVCILGGLSRTTHGVLRTLLIAVAVVLVVAVLARALRIGVWADGDRVVVQNLLKTYAFEWADVSRIDARLVTKDADGFRFAARWWTFRMHDGHGVIAQALPFWAPDERTQDLARTARTAVEYERPTS